MKVKIIDILNKIANGEEIPKKIRFMGCRYTWDDDLYRYTNEDDTVELHSLTSDINIFACINDEIEIIDDAPKKIEKIPVEKNNHTHRLKKIEKKLNEIIDYINKKGE